MITFTLSELTKALTKDEVEQAIYSTIEASGTTTSAWQPGAVTRAMISGCAIVLAAMSSLVALIASGGFLSLARGQWLTLVAYHVFGVERRAATFAAGDLTLTNNGAGVFAPAVGDVIVSNTTTGKLYRNTEAFSLGIGEALDVSFAAFEAGINSTAAIGEVTTFETELVDVSITNAAAWVGLDEQSDPDLRALCLATRDSVSPNGPKRAYEKFAKSAVRSDGTAIGVTRVRSLADGDGGVTTYVATASGAVSGTEGDELTDLGAVAASIRENVEPLCVVNTTASASIVSINVTYELWAWSDIDVSTAPEGATPSARIKSQILLDLAEYMSEIPIGGQDAELSDRVFHDSIRTLIGKAFPEIYRVKLTVPSSDTTLTVGQAPAIGTVSGVVNLVQRQG